MVALLVVRERTRTHILGERRHRLDRLAFEVGVAADELRHETIFDAEQVVIDEHLPIGVHPGPDADGRDRDCLCDHFGHSHRDTLQHDRKTAGVFERLGGLNELAGVLGLGALHLETTHRVDRLGSETDMAHHRDLGVDDLLDHRESLASALELHRVRTGPHQPSGIANRLLRRDVVAHPGQVGDDVAVGLGPGDRRRVVHHVVDRHLQGVVVPEHDHGDGVADENEVGTGLARDASTRCVVRRDHHERITTITHLARSDCRGREAHD